MTVEWLADPGGHLRINDAKALAGTRAFQPLPPGKQHTLARSGGGVWFRLTLQNTEGPPAAYILEVADARLDHVQLYMAEGGVTTTGSAYAASARALPAANFAFPVGIGPQPRVHYLNIRDDAAAVIPLRLHTAADFAGRQQLTTLLEAVSYGEIGALALLGLLLGVVHRSRKLLLYGALGAAFVIALLAGNGHGRLYLWPTAFGFDAVAEQSMLCLTAGLGAALAREILDLKPGWPRLDRTLAVGVVLFLGLALTFYLSLVVPPWQPFQRLMLLIGAPLLGVVVVAASIVMARRGTREMRAFGVAHAIVWSGGVLAATHSFGLLPSNAFTFYALQWSVSLGTLLMALALLEVPNNKPASRPQDASR